LSRVSNGDTITVVRAGEERRIRFCGIDAPETAKRGEPGQPKGEESRQFVEEAIARFNGEVGIEFVEKDRYGRWVGEIWLNVGGEPPEIFLNAELVTNGLAWPYKQYWGNCPNKMTIAAAEEMANQSGAGIWLNPENMPPWEFRRKN
jgi:micrococcal nuclease